MVSLDSVNRNVGGIYIRFYFTQTNSFLDALTKLITGLGFINNNEITFIIACYEKTSACRPRGVFHVKKISLCAI